MVSLGNISTPATIFPTRYAAAAGSRKHQCRASIAARDELLGLISDDERGLRSQKDKRRKDRILRAFEALAAESVSSDGITTDSRLSGTWRMLWTTEKEQLFIVDKAPLFGTRAGDILQVIDVGENRLNNVITFPPSGAFVVASTMEVVSDKRVEFQLRYTPVVIPLICSSGHRFTGALLRSDTWSLPVPPFGKGCVLHVSADVSGDLSGTMRSLKEILPTNETSPTSGIGVPLDVVDKVLELVTQLIACLKDLVLKVPLLCVILYPVIIILEIIVIYIPGGFPCPIIIEVICKYLGNAIPVWTPIKFIKVDLTVIVSLTTTIKLLQSVIILVTPNSCIFLVLSALVNILQSVLGLLY
ncbi:hypothetical protein SELMODRAFT_437607 [Selaginella moellendorffii]|uniref:Plastid lipid-associated protein/fibrillin conserved domain-containing protein n=1 Tax=Selaginella moellendorffii TaxID=88036 RepID=D8QNB9_SELML|nr:hypothetical protein SELMODRAFT_437607 [Selaginella moellendorffii]